jgi:3-oxoacyl-[acyl-carrier protein] reductase
MGAPSFSPYRPGFVRRFTHPLIRHFAHSLTLAGAHVSSLAMKGPLAGKVAVVTGVSRTKGIGAAISRELARQGANLFMAGWPEFDTEESWKPDELEQPLVINEIRDLGVEAEWIALDLSLNEAPQKLWAAVQARFSVAHILVNNACFWAADSIETLDAGALDSGYAVNTRAPILLSLEFVRRFAGKGACRVISMTSGQMLGSMRGQLGYAVTKAGLEAFTITFAAEVGHLGITVNAVDPGPTDSGAMTADHRQKLLPRFALGRLGQPEDAARLIAFLAGPDGGWITGQILRSRGGFE